MPQQGIHAVTVPGAVSGWMALHERFGTAPLETILSAAIAHAENGFPVSEITSLEWLGSVSLLRSDASAGAVYLPDGRPPEAGEIFRNPDLARSLRAIAAHGGDAFYRGEIAARILECSDNRGGAFTPADLVRLPGGVGDAPDDDLSGLGGLRDPAEQPGHRRVDHVEHPRELPAPRLWPRHGRDPAHADRSEEAGLCRHAASRRRSALFARCRSRRCCRRRTRGSAPA